MEKSEQQGWILKTKVLWERVVATVTASAPHANWDRRSVRMRSSRYSLASQPYREKHTFLPLGRLELPPQPVLEVLDSTAVATAPLGRLIFAFLASVGSGGPFRTRSGVRGEVRRHLEIGLRPSEGPSPRGVMVGVWRRRRWGRWWVVRLVAIKAEQGCCFP